MSKIGIFLYGLVAFIFGGVIAWGFAAGHYHHVINRSYNNSQIAEMMLEVQTLKNLRSGDITGTIDKLEYNLDWTLIALTPSLEKKPETLIEQAEIKEIEKAKDYRAKFPRKTGTQADQDVVKVFTLLQEQSKP
jgi:hypothetical protein